MKAVFRITILRAFQELVALAAWWMQELRDLADALLTKLAPGRATRVIISLDYAGTCTIEVIRGRTRARVADFGADAAVQLPAELRGAPALLALKRDAVFIHELKLPESARRDRDRIVTLHLEREFPIPAERICVHHRLIERLPGRRQIRIELLIAHRERIDRLCSLARQVGVRPVRAGFLDESGAVVGQFLPGQSGIGLLRVTAVDRRLASSAAALVTCLLGIVLSQWLYERIHIGRELRRLSIVAATVTRLADQLHHDAAPAVALARISSRADAVDVIIGLTDLIPVDSWAYDLRIDASASHNAEITISGFTPAATALVDRLAKSTQLREVRLVSAMSAGLGSGQDRLQFSASWPVHEREGTTPRELTPSRRGTTVR